MASVPWHELAAILHDAEIDLDTIVIDEAGLAVQGLLYRPGPSRWARTRRVPFMLRVPNAREVEIDDPAGLSTLTIAEVQRDGTQVVILSAIPGTLRFKTPDDVAQVEDIHVG